jgi:hypothetical protein
MCVNDIRLARLTSTVTTAFDVTGGGSLTIQPSRQRVGLFISANILMLTSQGVLLTFTGGQTLIVTGVNTTVWLNLIHHGNMIQQGFTISQLTGNITGRVTETLLSESILSAAEKEFTSPMSKTGMPGY